MLLIGDAHLVAGGRETIPRVLDLLENSGIRTRGNPDMYLREYRRFGIDDARELADRACLRALGGGKRIFIVAAPGMTAEAQNALLKTLEEPAADALFFLLVPSPETLLPTLRSRMQSLVFPGDLSGAETIDADEFLKAPPLRRMSMLKPLLERDENDDRDVGAIIDFLSALERAIESANCSKEGLRTIYRARKYIMDKGALLKPLLEQVALLV